MESCQCVHCTGDNFHLEQMAEEFIDEAFSWKEEYLDGKPPSIYEKLDELHGRLGPTEEANLTEEIMSAISSVDNELIALALELPTEQAEKLLAIQERLY